jgi:hypothetical protein
MKMKALVALGLCLAFTFPLFAQEKKPQDTVYITPFAGCKVVLVGNGVTKLLKENNLEVLKNKFIEDYRESAKSKDFPAEAKSIIYLASQDGRRRLKAMPDEDLPLNIEAEIKSFKNDLPPFHYTIYDLTKNFEYHIYVKDTSNLNQLYNTDLSVALKQTPDNSIIGIKRSRAIVIEPTATAGWIISRSNTDRKDYLILSPVFGVSLINSSFSPNFGFDVNIQTQTKYGKPNLKFGVAYRYNVLADYENKTFSNFYRFDNLDLFVLENVSLNKDVYWFGLSLGRYYTDKVFGSARNGTLDKAWKFGFVSQIKNFGIEYNFIRGRDKNSNSAVTLSYHF